MFITVLLKSLCQSSFYPGTIRIILGTVVSGLILSNQTDDEEIEQNSSPPKYTKKVTKQDN